MLSIEPVENHESNTFRQLVLAYWRELMPLSDVITDEGRREAYFQQRFSVNMSRKLYQAVLDEQVIGFMNFRLDEMQKQAVIEDFYVIPSLRRHGHGSMMLKWLFAHFDAHGMEQIDLNVRRDNPDALAFWQAQGFGIATYRLRQYRDPQSGKALTGSLSSDS